MQFAAGGQKDKGERRCLATRNVSAPQRPQPGIFLGDLTQGGNHLARKSQERRAVFAVESGSEGPRRLGRIRRPDHVEVRDGPQSGNRLHRLVGRAVLAHPD